jgi:ABC-2 type transport system permease protein
MASEQVITGTGSPRVARVRVPGAGLRSDLRAVRVVWQRELIRFSRDRARMVTALVQPVLFLFVLGTGLSRLASSGTHGVNLRTFVYPGVLAMAVLFTAIFSAASVVWDREFGFLREMLVAPVSRGSIVLGKCLGGASVAAFQGLVVIALAGLVDVPYAPLMIVEVFAMQVLLAFTLTAFGVMLAVRIKQMQSFMAVTQMLLMPMFFISGALFPLAGLPVWLTVLNRIDPVTYAVDPIRHTVFSHLKISDSARHALNPGVTWWGWHLPVGFEVAIVAAIGVAMLATATLLFSRDG